jgi:hypothetical protein
MLFCSPYVVESLPNLENTDQAPNMRGPFNCCQIDLQVPSEHSDCRGMVAEMSQFMRASIEKVPRAQNLVVYKMS